jgi:hypothetical protein
LSRTHGGKLKSGWYGREALAPRNEHAALLHARDLMPLVRQIQAAGLGSVRGIANELNRRRVATPRGGKWHPTSVHRLLLRIEELTVSAKLRFPNPGSDFDRLVNTYALVYRAFGEDRTFTLDDAVRVLINRGQVSSRGAVGQEAIERSTELDRSRDPLYNQLKMYTEIFRMLGWVHPTEKKLLFRNTMLGGTVAAPDPTQERIRNLLQECLLGIVFPNPNTENIGIERLRFFPLLLKFMEELDGLACRDEIIIGLYTITDDSDSDVLKDRVARIKELRGKSGRLQAELEGVAASVRVQVNTLQNYTRFPLGVIKSQLVGWAVDERVRGPYERAMQFYRLTPDGQTVVQLFYVEGRDVRADQIDELPPDDRAFILLVGHAAMHQRAGFIESMEDLAILRDARRRFPHVDRVLHDASLDQIYFSPFQQAEHRDIARALALYDELMVRA